MTSLWTVRDYVYLLYETGLQCSSEYSYFIKGIRAYKYTAETRCSEVKGIKDVGRQPHLNSSGFLKLLFYLYSLENIIWTSEIDNVWFLFMHYE